MQQGTFLEISETTQEKEMEIGTFKIMVRGQPGLSSVISFPLLLNKITSVSMRDKTVAKFRLTSGCWISHGRQGDEKQPSTVLGRLANIPFPLHKQRHQ